MSQDSIADFCTSLRNGYMAKKKTIVVPKTRVTQELVRILEKEGYVKKIKNQKSKIKNSEEREELVIDLKYEESGKPVISKIKRVSKPGLRVYKKAKNLTRILSGLGLAIISTPKGLMTDAQARKQNLGGEILCQIW